MYRSSMVRSRMAALPRLKPQHSHTELHLSKFIGETYLAAQQACTMSLLAWPALAVTGLMANERKQVQHIRQL